MIQDTNCSELSNNKIIPASENTRKFRIKNDSRFNINKVKVDDCYIKNGLRCDYLFEIISNKLIIKVFYLELKGKDVNHAIEQLKATLKYCQEVHDKIIKQCYIVASKVPSSNASTQSLKKKFKRENKVQLFISSKIKEVTL